MIKRVVVDFLALFAWGLAGVGLVIAGLWSWRFVSRGLFVLVSLIFLILGLLVVAFPIVSYIAGIVRRMRNGRRRV